MIITNLSYQIDIFNDYMKENYPMTKWNMIERCLSSIHELNSIFKYEIRHNILNEDTIEELIENRSLLFSVIQDFLISDFKNRGWFNTDDSRISVQSCYMDYDYLHIRTYYNGIAENDLLNDQNLFGDDTKFRTFSSTSYNDAFGNAFPELFEPNEKYPDRSDIFVHSFTFQTSEDCNLNCTYCVAKGTKVLMADFSEKNIENIQVGDIVLGIDEFPCDDNYDLYKIKNYYPTKVTETFQRKAKTVKLNWCDDRNEIIRITDDHPILTANCSWKGIIDISESDDPSDAMIYLADPRTGYITNLSDYEYTTEDYIEEDVYNIETESHTYIANKIVVHNCYQLNKTAGRMSFDVAKKCIDDMLSDRYDYLNQYNSPALIMEFIGGEPLLEINLTRKIYEYFLDESYRLNHPWFKHHRISMCSNGLLYFDRDVQSFFEDYKDRLSFNISIDGNRSLHDSARIQPNHEGSYDVDITAYAHYIETFKEYNPGSKMTIAPSNIKHLYESLINFINLGFKVIHLNCVFEEGWTLEHASIYYKQLQQISDYILENNLEKIDVAVFSRNRDAVNRLDKTSDNNFCFKAGSQVLTLEGNKNIEDIKVGEKVFTASGTEHIVTKTHKHFSENNVKLEATGIFPIECTSNHAVFAKKFLYMGWKGKIHYSEKGFYPVSELKKGDKIGLSLLNLKNNTRTLDPALAYALGMFLADGCIDNNKVVIITPGYDMDEYYLNKLKEAGLIIGITKSKTTNQYRISLSYSENYEFIELCKECGHLAHNKHIPKTIFECDIDTIEHFISGYMDSDGYVVKNGPKAGHVKLNTVSVHLANDISILLRSLGYYPTVYHYKRAGKMIIENRVVNVRDRYEVYFFLDKRQGGSFKEDDEYPVLWTTIRSIIPIDSFDVYNITVEGPPTEKDITGEHSMILNGAGTRQCGGTSSMLALDYKGIYYPCVRYMPSSLGADQESLEIGTIDRGIETNDRDRNILDGMRKTTRRSQSNDICFECPVNYGCAWCFKAGTLITTINGDIPIEEISLNDLVLAKDMRYHEVKRIFKKKCDNPIILKINGIDDTYTTSEHPYWVRRFIGLSGVPEHAHYEKDASWVEAGDINKHDLVYNLNNNNLTGNWIHVDDVIIPDDSYDVYNLTIMDDPTFFANRILVHNCSALNYQVHGTWNKRATFICKMHITEILVNVYYWNLLNIKKPQYKLGYYKNMVPDEWALEIISSDELELLKAIELRSMQSDIENGIKK